MTGKMALLATAVLLAGLVAPGLADAEVGKNRDGVVYADVATREDLLKVEGVNAALADAILKGRPYADMPALDKVVAQHVPGAEQRKALYARLFLPINLNKATREEIMLMPGMGPRMAHEFEEYRPYDGIARFRREIGKYVDEAEVARFEQYVFVPIDLNTASDADIRTIPGVGPRMLHEFKEYRPYKNIERFRREIGKYVDATQVARMERYVTIK